MATLRSVTRAGLFAGASALAWATLVERNRFTVPDITVPLLPEGTPPVRVLHLSDTHLAPWQHRKIAWIASLAELRPDAVVLTGDFLGHRDGVPAVASALEPFGALGVPMFFVYGSNDYYGPRIKNPARYLMPERGRPDLEATAKLDNEALTDVLFSLGAVDLNNSAARATIAGHETLWFGLNDPHIQLDDTAEMDAAIAELAPPDDALRFGVVHAPYQAALNALVDRGAQHLFSGHTHGGQVRLPGIGALTTNSDLPNAQASGLSVWHTAHGAASLNVSAGLGTSIFAPARFFCAPEAPLVTFETVDQPITR